MALPIIPNQTPPTVGVFDRYWVTQLTVINNQNGVRMTVEMAPYDGTNILVDGKKRMMINDFTGKEALTALMNASIALMKSRASKAIDPFVVTINAPSPSKAVQATGLFTSADPAKPDHYSINDILTLAETDLEVAQVVGGLLTWIAGNVPA